jgi:hypothetical protein
MVEVANFRYWNARSGEWIEPRFKSALARIRSFRGAEVLRSTLEFVPVETLDLHGRYRPGIAVLRAPDNALALAA